MRRGRSVVTQLHYARQGEITPEMEFVALREGMDPEFVRSEVATELYAGSKKGAVGTLLSRAGNDVDQASLLVALLRAAGVPARYEIGTVLLTAEQANALAGADELSVSATALSSAGIRTDYASLGEGRGIRDGV